MGSMIWRSALVLNLSKADGKKIVIHLLTSAAACNPKSEACPEIRQNKKKNTDYLLFCFKLLTNVSRKESYPIGLPSKQKIKLPGINYHLQMFT